MTARSLVAARLSFAVAAAFLILLAALHVIKPELDPSWNMISQYEIGRSGWIMQMAFLCIALSCVSLDVAIWLQVRTIGGWIGVALLAVAATGMAIAAFAVTDPTTTPRVEMTAHGRLHGLGSMLGVPCMTTAIVLLSLSLRGNPAWASSRRSLLWTAQLPWVACCDARDHHRLASAPRRQVRPRRARWIPQSTLHHCLLRVADDGSLAYATTSSVQRWAGPQRNWLRYARAHVAESMRLRCWSSRPPTALPAAFTPSTPVFTPERHSEVLTHGHRHAGSDSTWQSNARGVGRRSVSEGSYPLRCLRAQDRPPAPKPERRFETQPVSGRPSEEDLTIEGAADGVGCWVLGRAWQMLCLAGSF